MKTLDSPLLGETVKAKKDGKWMQATVLAISYNSIENNFVFLLSAEDGALFNRKHSQVVLRSGTIDYSSEATG